MDTGMPGCGGSCGDKTRVGWCGGLPWAVGSPHRSSLGFGMSGAPSGRAAPFGVTSPALSCSLLNFGCQWG